MSLSSAWFSESSDSTVGRSTVRRFFMRHFERIGILQLVFQRYSPYCRLPGISDCKRHRRPQQTATTGPYASLLTETAENATSENCENCENADAADATTLRQLDSVRPFATRGRAITPAEQEYYCTSHICTTFNVTRVHRSRCSHPEKKKKRETPKGECFL